MTEGKKNIITTGQEELLHKLIHQELLLGEFYKRLARAFPQGEKFWNRLARAEAAHGKWLSQLLAAAKKSIVLFDPGKMNIRAVDTFIQGLEAHMEQIAAMTLEQAISVTVDYERSLIEKNVFTSFEGMTTSAKKTMILLAEETNSHLNAAIDFKKHFLDGNLHE